MATITSTFIFLLLTLTFSTTLSTSLYLSPKTTFPNYNQMLKTFKIFTYPLPFPTFTTPQQSHFYKSLLHSQFLTQDPTHAHLFFLPFPPTPSTSSRNIARLVRNIRVKYPFWNRTLGADHFYLSCQGVDPSNDRNVVELKKNSIQVSCFPTNNGLFVPHKDVTLPPVHSFKLKMAVNATPEFLGYMKLSDPKLEPATSSKLTTSTEESMHSLIQEISNHQEFKVEYESPTKKVEFSKNSRFCLFVYGSDMSWIVEAMASRCVPVVITNRPIQDLPLMDVIDWSEIALFVSSRGGAKGLKRVLDGIGESEYEKMMESGVVATLHLGWNENAQPHDAFHMVVYQLWLRRHTIRYARWVEQ